MLLGFTTCSYSWWSEWRYWKWLINPHKQVISQNKFHNPFHCSVHHSVLNNRLDGEWYCDRLGNLRNRDCHQQGNWAHSLFHHDYHQQANQAHSLSHLTTISKPIRPILFSTMTTISKSIRPTSHLDQQANQTHSLSLHNYHQKANQAQPLFHHCWDTLEIAVLTCSVSVDWSFSKLIKNSGIANATGLSPSFVITTFKKKQLSTRLKT